jgi:hypothetical protein
MGRPRLKGERLPDLSMIAEDPSTVWTPITVASWYGIGERTVEIVSDTAVGIARDWPPCRYAGMLAFTVLGMLRAVSRLSPARVLAASELSRTPVLSG